MEAQKLHYENISGLLIRREGALSWRCPLCKTEGQSSEVMRCCPECGSEEATIPGAHPAPSFADAYQGAMEDVAIWKKRALEAEDLNRKFVAAINGSAYMGEPAQLAPSIPEGWKKGVEDVTAMLQKKADDYADEYGYDDMGGLSFGGGAGGEVKMDYYNNLIELIEEVRAMLAAAPEAKP